VAAKEIGGHIWQAWDVDESSGILLEGRPNFERSSFTAYPQIIIMRLGEQLRADYQELLDFGIQRFHVLFARRLRKAFWEYEHGDKKAIRFIKVAHNNGPLEDYRYPPRFFVRGSVADACAHKTIELSYRSGSGRRLALARIESGLNLQPLGRTEVAIGSESPTLRFYCDGAKVWRALAKIAVNLLHHFCGNLQVHRQTFPRVIAEIMGRRLFKPSRLDRSGFVWGSDVVSMASNTRSHTFRLSWVNGWWNAAMAFFGGQIGAFVRFPGPNEEQWCRLDIRAPIDSTDWTSTTSPIIIPARYHIEWQDLNKMIPTGQFLRD
jgi:hypothetical protein